MMRSVVSDSFSCLQPFSLLYPGYYFGSKQLPFREYLPKEILALYSLPDTGDNSWHGLPARIAVYRWQLVNHEDSFSGKCILHPDNPMDAEQIQPIQMQPTEKVY
jgi:hypothetical protein